MLHFTGGADLAVHDVDEAVQTIRKETPNDCEIRWSQAFDPELKDGVRVSIALATMPPA